MHGYIYVDEDVVSDWLSLHFRELPFSFPFQNLKTKSMLDDKIQRKTNFLSEGIRQRITGLDQVDLDCRKCSLL